VKPYVIDASIAVKWVVEEVGTVEALSLRQRGQLIAPELLWSQNAPIFSGKKSEGTSCRKMKPFLRRVCCNAPM
jgi:hypothetical protein